MRAIQKVADGDGYVDPALMPAFLNKERENMLTAREREILQLLADGMSNADVAAKLFISQETVKSHVRHILSKLEADTRTHAVAIALRTGHHRLSTDLRRELLAQGRFLDGFVGGLRAVAAGLDAARRARAGHRSRPTRLFEPDATVLLAPAPAGERCCGRLAAAGVALGPLLETAVDPAAETSLMAACARDLVPAVAPRRAPTPTSSALRLRPARLVAAPLVVAGGLHRAAGAVRPRLDGRGWARPTPGARRCLPISPPSAAANAALFDRVEALLAQARIREAERAELSRRVVSAEQDERRRLSLVPARRARCRRCQASA